MATLLGGSVDLIETAIALSLGDEYGRDSMAHVFESLARPFEVFQQGRHEVAVPFTQGAVVSFPKPVGLRRAYVFPWSDVANYPTTLGAQTSVGRFALLPPWLGYTANRLMRLGVGGLLQSKSATASGSRRAIDGLKRRYAGRDEFALVVRAERGGRSLAMWLGGRGQASITAFAAAEFARLLAEGAVQQPGIWLPEQAVEHERFFTSLGKAGWTVSDTPHGGAAH
jgi:saccharopine dehydrogenase-like NADP-dependent oxidoreductase